ncbi:MAG: tetratricopeptide repeat protein [Deltaproteobacteria bacterium]|nr:tetratricopeptide repeat protein [Deltaproteobacteria bacterium]
MTDTVLDPSPLRRRYLATVLHRFINNKLTIADLDGISRKKLLQVAEMGFVKLKHGRLKEAREIFEVLAELDHLNPYHHAALGSLFQKQGQFMESIAEYTQALKLSENDFTSLVNRGEVFLRLENFKPAAEDFRKAILLDGKGTNLWANRARSLVIALKRNLDLKRAAAAPKAVQSRVATRKTK